MDKEKVIEKFSRHTLLKLTEEGRLRSVKNLLPNCMDIVDSEIENLLINGYKGIYLPAIVRRSEIPLEDDQIGVGFTSPYLKSNARVKGASVIKANDILLSYTPFDIVEVGYVKRELLVFNVFEEIYNFAKEYSIKLGVWGSIALEILTTLNYCHVYSDLDILIEENSHELLNIFYKKVLELENKFAIRIDTEVLLGNGYGISLKELFSEGSTVLGKSINDLAIISKSTINN